MKKVFLFLAFIAFLIDPSVSAAQTKINIARQPVLTMPQATVINGQISVIVDSSGKKVARLINVNDFGVKADVVDNTPVSVLYNVANSGNTGLAGKIVKMTVSGVVSYCIVDKLGNRIDFAKDVDLSPYLTTESANATYATKVNLATTNDNINYVRSIVEPNREKFDNLLEGIGYQSNINNKYGFSLTNAESVGAAIRNELVVSSSYIRDGVRHVRPFKSGILRMRVNAGSKFLLYLDDSTNTNSKTLAIWHNFSGRFEVGSLLRTGVGDPTVYTSFSNQAVLTADYYVEINYEGNETGKKLKIKTWNVGQAYPNSESIYTFSGAEDLAKGGGLVFCSILTVTTFQEISISDTLSKLKNKATFSGYFYDDYKNGKMCLSTINAGSSIKLKTNRASYLKISYYVNPLSTQLPIFSIVDQFGKYVRYNCVAGEGSITIPVPKTDNEITVFVKGLHEHNLKWVSEQGVSITGIESDGVISKPETRENVAFFGDSITEGVLGEGSAGGSNPTNNLGDLCYANVLGKLTNSNAWVHGFGLTGITRLGNGGVPVAVENISYFSHNKPVYGLPYFSRIYINYGTTDVTSSATFTEQYNIFIAKIKELYNFGEIVLLIPLNAAKKADIISVATTNNIRYIDMSIFSGVTYTDGLHPDEIGHFNLAKQLISAKGVTP